MVLNHDLSDWIGEAVVDALETEGFTPEESIPGLVTAIGTLAGQTRSKEGALDEAMDLLADLGVEHD